MIDRALQALAEPRRRAILRLLGEDERASGDIAAHFEVSHAAISQHLRTLADAGLVSVRKDGTRRLYQVRPEGLRALRDYLEEFWEESLWRLKEAAEAEEGRGPHGDTT